MSLGNDAKSEATLIEEKMDELTITNNYAVRTGPRSMPYAVNGVTTEVDSNGYSNSGMISIFLSQLFLMCYFLIWMFRILTQIATRRPWLSQTINNKNNWHFSCQNLLKVFMSSFVCCIIHWKMCRTNLKGNTMSIIVRHYRNLRQTRMILLREYILRRGKLSTPKHYWHNHYLQQFIHIL